jgi:prephenate dehydrogenase
VTTGPVGVVGLGLMGGSIALALQDKGIPVIAVERDPSVRALAEPQLGEVRASVGESLSRCPLVILATPVAAVEALLGPVSAVMADGAILTDVAGVKVRIAELARERVRSGVRFVGSHPMFGGVEGGFAAASAALVTGVCAVVEDFAEASAIETVARFWESLSVRVVRCSADAHDLAMAKVSHLPYLLPCLLARDEHPLAGRGFADATRLARFSFDVQGEVARRNPHLGEAIDELIARLREVKSSIDDPEALRALLRVSTTKAC